MVGKIAIALLAALVASRGWAGFAKVAVSPDGEIPTFEAALAKIRDLRASGLPQDETVEVSVRPGLYRLREPLVLKNEDSNIRFVGPDDGSAVLDGSIELGRFSEETNGLWSADVPNGLVFDQLWMNGRRTVRARTPNASYLYMRERDDTSMSGAFYANPEDIRPLVGSEKGELSRVLVAYWLSWDMGYANLKSIDPENGHVRLHRQHRYGFFNWDKTHPRYVLENFRSALDAPGEWFLDVRSGKLLYMPREGESVATTRACVPVLQTVLHIVGDFEKGRPVRNVSFDGISVEYSSLPMEAGGVCNEQAAVNVRAAAVLVEGAEGFSFARGRIAHTGGHGVWFRKGTHRSRIVRALVEDLGAGGVYFGDVACNRADKKANGFGLELTGSIVRSGGRIMNGAVGVWLGHVYECAVRHNDISDFFYTGVSFGWCWGYSETSAGDNHIDWNHIHHIQQGRLSDGGAVYSLGRQEGSTVCNNWIHDVNGYRDNGSPAWGLYTDEGSSGMLLASNLVERCRSGAVHQHYGRNNRFVNNIFATFDDDGLLRSRSEDCVSMEVERNILFWDNPKAVAQHFRGKPGPAKDVRAVSNLYWCTQYDARRTNAFNLVSWDSWRACGCDVGGRVADPGFADAARGDWTLPDDSPAIGIGFVPFDWRKAGVSADDLAWRNRADERTWEEFADAPRAPRYQRKERFSLDCEHIAVGPLRNAMGLLSPFVEYQGVAGTLAIVSDEGIRGGAKALEFAEFTGIRHCEPYIESVCRFDQGLVKVTFSAKFSKDSVMCLELRDYDSASTTPYLVGASVTVRDLSAFADGRFVCKVPSGQWADFELELPLDGAAAGAWRCTVRTCDKETRSLTASGWKNSGFRHLTWIGFMSFGNEGSRWRMNNVRVGKCAMRK